MAWEGGGSTKAVGMPGGASRGPFQFVSFSGAASVEAIEKKKKKKKNFRKMVRDRRQGKGGKGRQANER